MKVFIHSRKSIERIISDGSFPIRTVVISFSDTGGNDARVSYKGASARVFYCNTDDLDVMRKEYDDFMPESDEMAEFIYKAYNKNFNILCQCEFGQSLAPACAAAILEHFYHDGISIFSDSRYFPNQFVYRKISDALEKYRKYNSSTAYYCGNLKYIMDILKECGMPEELTERLKFDDKNSCIDSKTAIEDFLDEKHLLHKSEYPAISHALSEEKHTIISMQLIPEQLLFEPMGYTYGFLTHFKYGCENLPVTVWVPIMRHMYSFRGNIVKKNSYLDNLKIKKIDLLGIMKVDKQRRTIDIIPLILTN